NPTPETRNPEPGTRNPEPETPIPNPESRIPDPETKITMLPVGTLVDSEYTILQIHGQWAHVSANKRTVYILSCQ
ncbi:hypothetical protein T484DRAFT_1630791, partial [Baffinella frigidus]